MFHRIHGTLMASILLFASPLLLYLHLWDKLSPGFRTREILNSPSKLTWLGVRSFLTSCPFTPEEKRPQYCWILGIWRAKLPVWLHSSVPLSGPISPPTQISSWEHSLSLRFQPSPSSAHLPVNVSSGACYISFVITLGSLPGAWTPSGIVTWPQMYPLVF